MALADVPGRDAPPAPIHSPPPRRLGIVLERNIRSLKERRDRELAAASVQERIAEAVTRFAGSMAFVWVHLAAFGFWIIANVGWLPGVRAWDDSFVMLAMIASVEAIFLSTFVLITQNCMAAAAAKQADLDLQVSLLAEHELTKLARMVSAMAARLGVATEVDAEMSEIGQDIAPEAVLDEIEEENGR